MIKKIILLIMIAVPGFIIMQEVPEALFLYIVGIIGAKFL